MKVLAFALAGLLGLIAIVVGAVLGVAAVATLVITARISARHPPEGPFVAVAGGRLATIQAGPETDARGTVVLLHGASANASDPMEGVGRTLAARGFRVIAFDRPGFGWSDRLKGSEAARPSVQGDAIAEALARMGVGPAIVLGHSWAGALALSLALDHPERVAGLVLVAPVALPFRERPTPPWYWRLAIQPPVAWLLSRTIGPPLGLYFLDAAARNVFRPQPVAEDYLARSRAALVLRPDTLLASLQDLIALPAALAAQAPRYGTLHVPTTIVTGDADGAVGSAAQAEPLSRIIPEADLVVLPGIGHMVPWVATQALADAVSRTAERIAAPQPATVVP